MAYPIELKQEAIDLRKKGYSIKEVSKKLNIAKSTSSYWLRSIKLNQKALKRLQKRKIIGQYKASLIKKEKRKQKILHYHKISQQKLDKLKIDKTLSQLICSILYWAEGGKFTDNNLQFTNSDPTMISTYLYLLRKGFDIKESSLRINMHLHDYHNEQKQRQFWSNITGIPKTQFTKTYQKPNTQKRKRKNYPGCVRISYYSSDTARKVISLYKEFSKKIGA